MKSIHKINFWLYRGKRITKWHYDGHDNFLYVKEGQKTVYLAPPNSLSSQSMFSLFNNHLSNKNNHNNRKKSLWKTTLKKNDCLFIPKGWWHYVVSTGDLTIAINFWGNSISTILSSLTEVEKNIILKELVFNKCDQELSKRVKKWE